MTSGVFIGGRSGGGVKKRTITLNGISYSPPQVWTTKAALPTARYSAMSGVVDGKMYVIGGYNGSRLAINECYDPVTNTWTTKAVMPTARTGAASGIIDGGIYFMGGDGTTNRTINEKYIPIIDNGATLTSLFVAGKATMTFNKKTLWGENVKEAGVQFTTEEPGTLYFIDSAVSGTIIEDIEKEVTINEL
jgi:hypothetical protein